jgi:succinate dehydrogenase/fumarate reductase flavoprotein subunit
VTIPTDVQTNGRVFDGVPARGSGENFVRGCLAGKDGSALRMRWHMDADVVVIGLGAAGAVAAITAHDGGARVLILEKQEVRKVISNSFMSGGSFICPSDVQEAKRYMESLCKVDTDLYWTDPDILHTWAQYTSGNKAWIEGMGGTGITLARKGGEYKLPGFESIDVYHSADLGGPGLMRLLDHHVNTRRIGVMHQTRAMKLLTNSKGEVTGVCASTGGEEAKLINIKSRRAVILTTGGFEFDEGMKLQYLKVYPTYFLGTPANTGDGIRMALGVGAQLWHMNCCSARLVMKFPDLAVALNPVFGGKDWSSPWRETELATEAKGGGEAESREARTGVGYIIVDRAGKRYARETFKPHSFYYELAGFDTQKAFYPRVPSYWIFDQKRLDDGPLVRTRSGAAGPAGFCRWSADNREELDRGWIIKGNTIKELADQAGLGPECLTETVHRYNEYCRQGKDVEFGRQPSTLVPLDTGPYYAVKLWPGGPNTQGGPQRNSRAQIVRPDGTSVPRLYGAGELGSIYGMLYPAGGGNLAECIAFGRIAGENASEEDPL